ncbi:MAG TPA: alpha/beta hydrolase [Patescibacteria group bacterium]|nr:alpha/beta hydrolase [Patescibacteria group bacterium]
MHTKDYTVKSFDGEKLSVRLRFYNEASTVAIVFVHGLGGDQVAWEFTIEHLLSRLHTTKYLVCTYDLRGHGRSTRSIPTHDHIFVTQAKDLSAVIDLILKEKKIEEIVLIGHSLGSFAVQQYTNSFLHPQVKKIILISAPSRSRGLKLPTIIARLALHLPWKFFLIRTREHHTRFIGTGDFHLGRIWSDLQSVGLPFYVALETLVFGRSVQKGATSSLPVETYVIAGERDLYFSSHQMELFQRGIGAKDFIVIPGAGHAVPVNNAEYLAKIIASIIEKI